MPTSTPPEYALLLDATVPLPAERVDHRAWDAKRWGGLLHAASWHRLSAALFCHLDGRDGVPGAVRSALERSYLANAARSMYMASALTEVLGCLSAAGVPSLLLKGAALVQFAYPDPAHREMLDLDLLVPPQRVGTATQALEALGYRPDRTQSGPGTPLVRASDRHHDAALVAEQQVLAIELHRHILIDGEGTRFDIDDLWRRAQPTVWDSHFLPSPEDLLLHVCLHFTRNRLGGSSRHRHTGGALAQVYDIQRLTASTSLDWDALVTSSCSYRLQTRVFLALSAAQSLGVAIPEEPLRRLAPPDFDPRLSDRLVALRVLGNGDHLPVRSMRWMFAPGRDVLSRGWNADSTAILSLARAYLRRARAHVPQATSTLRRPVSYLQDQRLNGQIRALEERT